MIRFALNESLKDNIYQHLQKCDEAFRNHLKSRVDINEYAQKLFDKAQRYEAWDGKDLVGLVACYHNHDTQKFDFITSVSVIRTYARQGVASTLLKSCIDYARAQNALGVRLEVAGDNITAQNLYSKFGFVREQNDIIFHTLSFKS